MKAIYRTQLGRCTLLICVLLIWFSQSIRAGCIKPTFTSPGGGVITRVTITNPSSKFKIVLLDSISKYDNQRDKNTNLKLSNKKLYHLDVSVVKFAAGVGLFIDKDNNALFDATNDLFVPLVRNNTVSNLFSADFYLDIATPDNLTRTFVILSSENAKMDISSLCSGQYRDGEAEYYKIGVSDCAVPPKGFTAGANDTICAGGVAQLNPQPSILAKGDQAFWNSNPNVLNDSSLIQKIALKQRTLFTFHYRNGASQCEYSDTKAALVDIVPRGLFLSGVDSTICQGQTSTLTINDKNQGRYALNISWFRDFKLLSLPSSTSLGVSKGGNYYAEISYATLANCNAKITTNNINMSVLPSPIVSISSNNLCSGSSTLTAVSPTTQKNYNYTWYYKYGTNYDTAPLSDTSTSTYKPTNLGDYYVSVNASNFQCQGKSAVITILPSPSNPSITSSFKTICMGQSDTLRPTFNQNPLPLQTYEWFSNYGKTKVSTGMQYITNVNGNYVARAIAVNGCSSNFSRPVQVNFKPLVKLNLTPNGNVTLCAAGPVTFSLRSDSIDSQSALWYLGSINSNPAGKGPSFTTSANTIGKVYVRASSFNGCVSLDSAIISVISQQPAVITPSGLFCQGQSVLLSTSIGNGSAYAWKKDGVVINPTVAGKPTLSINSDGLYTVDIQISNNQCSKTASYTAKFNATPTQPIIAGNSSLCAGSTQTLTTNAAPSLSFQWFKSGVSLANTPTLLISDSGRYQVKVINTSNCASLISNALTVNKINLTTPKIAAMQGMNCLGQNQGFSITPTLTFTPIWYKDDIKIIGANNLNFIPTQPGAYSLSFIAQGCSSAVSNAVNIFPKISVAAPADKVACLNGDSISLKAQSPDKVSFNWSVPNVSNDKSILNIIPNAVGKRAYVVTARDVVTNCTAFDTVIVNTINNNLNIQLQNRNVICFGGLGLSRVIVSSGNGGYTYTWNDTIVSKIDSLKLKAGSYYVKVKDALGCVAFSQSNIQDALKSNMGILPTIAQPTCVGKADGSISVMINNYKGVPKIKWNIPNKIDSTKISGLLDGTYVIDVTDDLGCASLPIILTKPSDLLAGNISSVKTVEEGSKADTIRNLDLPRGGRTPISLSWQKDENCVGQWIPINNETKAYFSPGAIVKTTCYRRVAKNSCGITAFTTPITVNVVKPTLRDTAFLSGGGELGFATIKIELEGNAPWTIILTRIDGQIQSRDTIKQITASPYIYKPLKKGLYTIYKVNENLQSGSGSADIYITPISTSSTTAIMYGGGTLGDTIKVKFRGRKKYPLVYTYFFSPNQNDEVPGQTLVITNIKDSLINIIPTAAGYYYGLSVVDSDDTSGNVTGEANIEPSIVIDKKPTADIAGGGLLGSQIIITISPNGTLPSWYVLVGIDYDSAGTTYTIVDSFNIDKSPFSFPSRRAGTYRVKSVNGNRIGNGEAFVYVEERDSSEVFVWNAVSPNGDGKNDLFEIEIPTRISDKNAQIVIFDREGTKLANLEITIGTSLQLNAAKKMFVYTWDCKNESNELLNPGTYFYSFKVAGFEKDKRINKSGFLEIRR